MDYRCGSHTVFQIEYHFVWVTKYRYKVLSGDVAERVRELLNNHRLKPVVVESRVRLLSIAKNSRLPGLRKAFQATPQRAQAAHRQWILKAAGRSTTMRCWSSCRHLRASARRRHCLGAAGEAAGAAPVDTAVV